MQTPVEIRFGVIDNDNPSEKMKYQFVVKREMGNQFFDAQQMETEINDWLIDNISAPKDRWALDVTNTLNSKKSRI